MPSGQRSIVSRVSGAIHLAQVEVLSWSQWDSKLYNKEKNRNDWNHELLEKNKVKHHFLCRAEEIEYVKW